MKLVRIKRGLSPFNLNRRDLTLSGISRLFVATYSTKMRGGFLRFQAQYLRRIRLPQWCDVPDAMRETLRDAAIRRDLDACNRAAFSLYGLTADERAALSGNGGATIHRAGMRSLQRLAIQHLPLEKGIQVPTKARYRSPIPPAPLLQRGEHTRNRIHGIHPSLPDAVKTGAVDRDNREFIQGL
ncbi:MAG: hypothetical protein HZB71_02230 [Betaproteobacteria bacterium]|nr:hypothetical protein [Betaproteobacteria bacterium]